jgi:hypothetical protein
MVRGSLVNLVVLWLLFIKVSSFEPRSRDLVQCVPPNTPAPSWTPNVSYTISTLVIYNGVLYKCIQAHISLKNWTPSSTPGLWASPTPCGVTPWQTQTLYRVDSVVTYSGRTYICIQSHESEENWTPDQTPALWRLGSATNGSSSCTITESNGVTTQHAEVTFTSNKTGVAITVILDQTTLPGSGLTKLTRGFGGASLGLQVFLGSDELISHFTAIFPNGTSSGSIHWGPLIQGAKSAFFTVVDGTVSGNIDNRSFNPFKGNIDAASLTLADGGLSPILTAAGGVNATLQGLEGAVSAALESCRNANSYNNSSTVTLSPRSDRLQDSGHFSDTYGTSGCKGCKTAAVAGVIIAEAICDASTCWWSFGLGCIACTAAAALATTAAIEGCEFSGACCPLPCGSGSFPLNPPTCCFGNEMCLDGNGHCCSSGQHTCAGRTCCNADQSCIEAGPQVGPLHVLNFHVFREQKLRKHIPGAEMERFSGLWKRVHF